MVNFWSIFGQFVVNLWSICDEAAERIGRQWLKAEEAKSGKLRTHEAATTAATVIASAAASAPQT